MVLRAAGWRSACAASCSLLRRRAEVHAGLWTPGGGDIALDRREEGRRRLRRARRDAELELEEPFALLLEARWRVERTDDCAS